MIEVLQPIRPGKGQIRAAIFDFDGTISTLRCGWERTMRPLMIECIAAGHPVPGLEQIVDRYIDESTGIQTAYQMRWLAEQVRNYGLNPEVLDEWGYKEEYNRRLMAHIAGKRAALASGASRPDAHMIAGAEAFLDALRRAGVALYVASGTDHVDVVAEVDLLGLSGHFAGIHGAPERRASCSKEAVIRMLIEQMGLDGAQLAVVGDGKVEIALAREVGAYALGVASDEQSRRGVDQTKRKRLAAAGACAITGDFEDTAALLALLNSPGGGC